MKTLIVLTAITVLIAIYVVALRPWLRKREWAKPFFANPVTEWIELTFFSKSESLLWARFLMVLGSVPGVLQTIAGIDVTPFIALIPEKYRPWLFMLISLLGVIAELNRRDTTKPLELVSVPEAVKEEPLVAEAEARREVATEVAVEIAQAAKP